MSATSRSLMSDYQLGVCMVIGGSGWTGSYVVHSLLQLAKEGHNVSVHSVDVCRPTDDFQELHDGDVFHLCDISDAESVNALFDAVNPMVVFHLASIIDLREHPSDALEKVNVDGTNNIIAALKRLSRFKPRCLIYTSSIDVVSGPWGCRDATEETPYPAHPTNGYKRTKIAAERAVLAANSRQF
jgi:nucleoside-diphosphate-sugar epimerase